MKLEITYPTAPRRRRALHRLTETVRWCFGFAALVCPVLNLCTGGRAWSVIVLWSLWMVWSNVFSPDLVEYNRISQLIKLIAQSCILLVLINLLLAPGWAVEVVSIVCFSGLAAVSLLFFTDLERQRHNASPLLVFAALCLVGAVVGLAVWREETRWALAVLGVFALFSLAGCLYALGPDFWRSLKKYFHTR